MDINSNKIRVLCFTPNYFRSKLNDSTVIIDGLLPIPNATMIENNNKKKKTAISEIRTLFNTITNENVDQVKGELRRSVTEFLTKLPEENIRTEMKKIADEMLGNFIVSEHNIKLYMQMLNNISNIAVDHIDPITGNRINSDPFKKYFIDSCKELILKYISEPHIRELILKDQEDDDDIDLFNKAKGKIFNLIITICSLYDQRNTPGICLHAMQLYGIINSIINTYNSLTVYMKKLGNPCEVDCEDEDEYEKLSRMCSIYSELVIIFLDLEYESFMKDKTIIQKKIMIVGKTEPVTKDFILADLIIRFKNEVHPHITEPRLRIKCEKFGCK